MMLEEQGKDKNKSKKKYIYYPIYKDRMRSIIEEEYLSDLNFRHKYYYENLYEDEGFDEESYYDQ